MNVFSGIYTLRKDLLCHEIHNRVSQAEESNILLDFDVGDYAIEGGVTMI